MPLKIIVTGAAGFIGFHTCKRLLKEKCEVIGIDNINDYYDINLKLSRLKEIESFSKYHGNWYFKKGSIENNELIINTFSEFKPDIVIHLAAQAGVRYSINHPQKYINSNIVGFFNIIESCRKFDVKNFLYASSSSVYGGNKNLPYKENNSVDHPISLYAATKKSNEVIAHSYSHLYNIPCTGIRFFTVYGPWGRPDMAPMIFTNSIIRKEPIKIFNNGKMKRDFTYIDDVVEAIYRCMLKPAVSNSSFNMFDPEPSTSFCSHRIFNLGNSNPVELLEFINCIETELGIKAIKEYLPLQPGDVEETFADNTSLNQWINFYPKTSLKDGIKDFLSWYKIFYKIN